MEAGDGSTVLSLIQTAGIGVRAECGGRGACRTCRVQAGPAESFSPPTSREREILDSAIAAGHRLACCTRVHGPATVTIPAASRLERIVALEESYGRVPHTLKPALRQLLIHVPEATLTKPVADGQRLARGVEVHTGRPVTIGLSLLHRLPRILREKKGQVTATIWQDRAILDILPGYQPGLWGVAVDLGTTSVVAYLFDLGSGEMVGRAARLNPQVPFGADVMSRINYATVQADGARRLQETAANGINDLIARTCAEARVPQDRIMEVVVVGNTAMHHLFLGLDVRHLGLTPFPSAWSESLDLPAREVGLAVHPAANLHLLPNQAGFVGADNTAVLLALEPHRQEQTSLIIDFGTNGEMVVGSDKGLWSCSTAAGPAFEGAHIRWGMRAEAGAIDRVTAVDGSGEVRWHTLGGAPPKGICGSGLVAAVAALRESGILAARGHFNPRCESPQLRRGPDGLEFVIAWPEESADGQAIVITQADVREVQVAKAAVAAGSRLLLRRSGAAAFERVLLAGAFGSYIEPRAAQTIGLLPSLPLEQVEVVGNAAGHGACLALLDVGRREEAARLARQVHYVELAAEPDFSDAFIDATALVPWT